jgi:hypothetical protein|tara:strand:+ start:433 stop:1239 length:807 start_codon:yes stop_codon:yes gene_type:complete
MLPILVSGFYVCHQHPLYKQKLYRYEGQYLYLLCAKNGTYCLFLGSIITLLADTLLPNSIHLTQNTLIPLNWIDKVTALFSTIEIIDKKETGTLVWIFSVSIATFLTALIWSVLAYLRFCLVFKTWKPKPHIAYKVLSDSPMDKLLFEASQENSESNLLMLSLSDRKVYVGKIITMGEPNELEGPDQEVTLIPVMSGYRDRDTLSVVFNTQYDETDKSVRITLRQDMVISATRFSFEAYEQLNPALTKPRFKLTESSVTQVYICQKKS